MIFVKARSSIGVFMLVILLASLYPKYVNAQTNQIIKEVELTICSSLALLDLNKAMEIAFSPSVGKWYNESGVPVSNIFVFTNSQDSEKYNFYFLVNNETVSCQLKNKDRFNLTINVRDIQMPRGESEQFLCYLPNETPTLNDLNVTGNNIKWYSMAEGGTTLPLETPLVDGETYYASEVLAGCGESVERLAVTVGVGLIPELVIQEPIEGDLTFDLNELNVDDLNNSDGILSYYSEKPEGLEDMSGLITNYILEKTQDIYVLMATPIGCYDINKVRVTVNQDLEVPNGFSPNGDGINDYFVINGIERYPESKLIVFNRWRKSFIKQETTKAIGMAKLKKAYV